MVRTMRSHACLLAIVLSMAARPSAVHAFAVCGSGAFSRPQAGLRPARAAGSGTRPLRGVPALSMGFLGWNFGDEMGGKGIREILGIITCEASHILVKGAGSAERCRELREEVEDRISIPMGVGIEDAFASVAREYSQCPSAKNGGNLGVFKPGQMVSEFDRAAFSAPILSLTGPVETKFGSHLILVKRRTGDPEVKSGGCG